MSLLGGALATLLIILTFSSSLFMRSESENGVATQTFQQDANIFTDYSNYVREMFRMHQQNRTSEYDKMLSGINSGSIIAINNALPSSVTGVKKFSPYMSKKAEYVTTDFINDNKVGHALARASTPYNNPKTDIILYVWTIPDARTGNVKGAIVPFSPERSFDALVKRDYGENKRMHYIKNGTTLVRNGGYETMSLRADIAKIIPDGALVVVSHPFERGPVK